jgi:hypothetical protein
MHLHEYTGVTQTKCILKLFLYPTSISLPTFQSFIHFQWFDKHKEIPAVCQALC